VLDIQFVDKEGRTPLILACTRGDLYEMVLTLLNLGANIKAYRPGRFSSSLTRVFSFYAFSTDSTWPLLIVQAGLKLDIFAMQGVMEAILFIMQQNVDLIRQYCSFYLVVVRSLLLNCQKKSADGNIVLLILICFLCEMFLVQLIR
jgi:hypothetical protein